MLYGGAHCMILSKNHKGEECSNGTSSGNDDDDGMN
jgi:hypothetical protein